MGFYSSLTAEKYDRQYSDRQLFARILHYFRPQLLRLLGVTVTLLVISGAGAAQPWAVSRGVDLMKTRPTGLSIAAIAGVVLGIGLVSWLANYVQRRLMVRAIADTLLKLATDAFRAAAEHDLSFYDEFSSGRIQSRITSDTRDFGNLVSLITELVSQMITTIILGGMLFRIEPRLTLYLLSMVPLVFVLTILYRQLARKVTRAGYPGDGKREFDDQRNGQRDCGGKELSAGSQHLCRV